MTVFKSETNGIITRCDCEGNNHTISFECVDPMEFPQTTVVFFHMNKLPFFQRLKAGLKYILFGTPNKFGHYDEVLLDIETTRGLRDYLTEIVRQGDEKISQIAEEHVARDHKP